MKNEIAISEFKAHCLEIVSSIEVSKKTIVITRRNKPVAKLIPFKKPTKKTLFGSMRHRASIKSDLLKPLDVKWDAEND